MKKLIQINLFTPLSFLDENSRWTSPGKLTHNFTPTTASEVPRSVRFQKIDGQLSSRGVKVDSNQLLLPLLVFGRKIHVELPGKVDSQFYAHYSQCSTCVRFKNWWTTFQQRGEKLIQIPTSLYPLLVLQDENSRWTSRESWLTIFTLTTASAVPSCSFKNWWTTF